MMAQRGLFVHQLPPGEGSFRAGREYYRPGAAFGGGADAAPDVQNSNIEGHDVTLMQAVANAIAERISSISVSSTMKVSADAEKLRAEGVDVVDFGAGEPDFPTPDNIKQAAIRALEQNFTKYTAAGGTLELKKAVCERHAQDFGTDYKPTECLITVGGKHAHLQPDAGADQSRRRSGDPGAVLGHLQGRGELRRRQVRVRRYRRSARASRSRPP